MGDNEHAVTNRTDQDERTTVLEVLQDLSLVNQAGKAALWPFRNSGGRAPIPCQPGWEQDGKMRLACVNVTSISKRLEAVMSFAHDL